MSWNFPAGLEEGDAEAERTSQAEESVSVNTLDINNHGKYSHILPEFKLYQTLSPWFSIHILPLASLIYFLPFYF